MTLAVHLESVDFQRDGHPILTNCHLHVPSACIYALLGPSGSGKTTLLNCALGLIQPQRGFINVLNHLANGQLPLAIRRKIGMMPQDLALEQECTIIETIKYYYNLQRTDSLTMNSQVQKLLSEFDFSDQNQKLSELSGGQRRRVSLIVALIHRPVLLILDEPTVSVDPLLRNKIWNFLNRMCLQYQTTIILTTHYIEEAMYTDTVGLMRDGRILDEDSPENIIRKFQTKNLEEAFIKMCLMDDKNRNNFCSTLEDIKSNSREFGYLMHIPNIFAFNFYNTLLTINFNLVKISKNLKTLFLYYLMVIIYALIFIVISDFHLNVAVFNEENPATISSNILLSLDSRIKLKNYDSLADAVDQVKMAKAWTAVHFSPNFTSALTDKLRFDPEIFGRLDNSTFKESDIKLHQDMTSPIIYFLIFSSFYQALVNSTSSITNIELFTIDVIYQENRSEMISVFLMCLLNFWNFSWSGYAIHREKANFLNRKRFSGLNNVDLLAGHFMIQVFFAGTSIIVVNFVTFVLFQMPMNCSFFDVFACFLIQAILSCSLGFFFGALSSDLYTFAISCVGNVLMCLVCPVFWPLEGSPKLIQWASYYLTPLTVPILTVRSVISKGFNSHFWFGLGFCSCWSVWFWMMTIFWLHFKV